MEGRIVYRRSTSRVFSLHGNCGQETSRVMDEDAGRNQVSVTRVLGQQSVTYVAEEDRHTRERSTRRALVGVDDSDVAVASFDHSWEAAAHQYLPQLGGRARIGQTMDGAAPYRNRSAHDYSGYDHNGRYGDDGQHHASSFRRNERTNRQNPSHSAIPLSDSRRDILLLQ